MNLRPLAYLALAAISIGCGGKSSKGTDAGGDTGSQGDSAADVVVTGGAGTTGTAGTTGGAGTTGAAGTQTPDAGDGGARDGGSDAIEGGADAGVDVTPPASGTPYRALAVSTGVTDACVLLDNHRVKCWGADAYGSLGSGSERPRGEPADMGNALPFVDLGTGRTATAIASGRYHTCAILDDGNVKCWGLRTMTGQPMAAGEVGIGDEPGEMGDALPPLNLGGHKAKQIACGYFLSCALVDDGNVWCWGDGKQVPEDMKVPATFEVRQLAGTSGVVALTEDGRVANVNGLAPGISLLASDRPTYVAGAMTRLCAVLEDGSAKCGAVGEAIDTPHDLAAIGVGMSSMRCGLSKTGDVRCWGASNCAGLSPSGTLYPPGTIYWCPSAPLADKSFAVGLGQKAVAVTSGGLGHTCALLADGGVKCWTSYDQCPNSAGGADACPVPPKPSYVLGGSVDIVGTGATRKFGAWRKIDFGNYP